MSSNRHRNWDDFTYLIKERLTLNVSLKTEEDNETAVNFFNDSIQWTSWNAIFNAVLVKGYFPAHWNVS
jgi:hypothetical protein